MKIIRCDKSFPISVSQTARDRLESRDFRRKFRARFSPQMDSMHLQRASNANLRSINRTFLRPKTRHRFAPKSCPQLSNVAQAFRSVQHSVNDVWPVFSCTTDREIESSHILKFAAGKSANSGFKPSVALQNSKCTLSKPRLSSNSLARSVSGSRISTPRKLHSGCAGGHSNEKLTASAAQIEQKRQLGRRKTCSICKGAGGVR